MVLNLMSDDIFISYSHWDASTYAPSLANQLIKKGYKPFYDRYGSKPGRELPEELKREIRRCQMFVLLATKRSTASESIEKEIEEFKKTKRSSRIIPVDVDGSLRGARWYHLVDGIAPEPEKNPDALDDGKLSASVLSRIDESFTYVKGKHKLRLATAVMAAIFVVLLLASVWASIRASAQLRAANEARLEAEQQRGLAATAEGLKVQALEELNQAKGALKNAKDETETAKKETITAQKATRAAEHQRARAEQMAQKQEAGAQSIALANASSRKVSAGLLEEGTRDAIASARRVAIVNEKTAESDRALRNSLAVFPKIVNRIIQGLNELNESFTYQTAISRGLLVLIKRDNSCRRLT